MDFHDLATNVYKKFKHYSQWNKQDAKRLSLIETFLQEEIEKELALVGLIPTELVSVQTELVHATIETLNEQRQNKINNNTEPMSLMQRVFAEQDATINNDLDNKKEIDVTVGHVKKPRITDETQDKRYYVTIMCSGTKTKPSFQIFKGHDVIATDFKTDEVITHQYTFYAVVDGTRPEIAAKVDEHFINAYISVFVEQIPDYIPPQYKTIWQNRTKMN